MFAVFLKLTILCLTLVVLPVVMADDHAPDSNITPRHVPIYCLAKFSDAQVATFEESIMRSEEVVLAWVQPDFVPWLSDSDGDLSDTYRIWNETGAGQQNHFAFFIDREGTANTSIIIAQPDAYTMLYSVAANAWANESFASYISDQTLPDSHSSLSNPNIHEGYLELVCDDILGNRGLTYGRVPADAFRSVWANLNIANMGMCELVEYHGQGKVEMVENKGWDQKAVMEKIKRLVRADEEREHRVAEQPTASKL